MKFAACIEYDGSLFSGWQKQIATETVQERVEQALSLVANEKIITVVAGRTDARVHATGQIIHFKTSAIRPMHSWVMGGNKNLPQGAAIKWVQPVADDFHARYGALERSYRYIIFNRIVRPTFLHGRVYWNHFSLDEKQMHRAGQFLLGEHDYSTFRAVGCQAKHPVREIKKLNVSRKGEMVYIDVTANAFLYNMVRIISGSLMMVGQGKVAPEWIKEILEAKDRTIGGVTAPASGLYFIGPKYNDSYDLPTCQDYPQL